MYRFMVDCMKSVGVVESHAGQLAEVLIEADERAGSAWVDGKNLLGPVVGNFCMDLAVKKAKDAGVGWVVAKGSNHFGIAAWYVMRAMKEGMMAMSFTNTSPVTYPTRSSKPALGTNPMCIGANGTNGDSYVLDMATTTVAIGKLFIMLASAFSCK
ncbi:malate/L-lactate dehydrogenase [Necator americanus]|uniref:Malate/L-lactate dehydrogenase n=1 Tax=Necator americanus TaxID=51031 RepID=W2SWA9_NECAM|nr:malate/L-lactate dehydrogenase [Necator americanus]ETN74044.1 malate/L-lactate dehydrogenase [Necator americanus]